MRLLKVFLTALLVLFPGCGEPLLLNYQMQGEPPFRLSSPLTVRIEEYKDLRRLDDPRMLGIMSATIADMSGNKLALETTVSELVTSAFKEELGSAGFKIEDGSQDFVLTGEIREFKLDITARDEIKIEIFSTVTDALTGKIIWSGAERVEHTRYAGVMGNSRKTISNYIVRYLSAVAKKTIANALPAITTVKPVPKVETPQVQKESLPYEAEKDVLKKEPPLPRERGRLLITTVPTRGKLYIGDIYYGLTPITIDLTIGIYEVRLIMEGFKTETEKVAVREGYTTELEVKLKKE